MRARIALGFQRWSLSKIINSVPLKINKNQQNPLSALGAMLLVQIITKNSLQASLQIVFTTNLTTLRVKSTQRHIPKKQIVALEISP